MKELDRLEHLLDLLMQSERLSPERQDELTEAWRVAVEQFSRKTRKARSTINTRNITKQHELIQQAARVAQRFQDTLSHLQDLRADIRQQLTTNTRRIKLFGYHNQQHNRTATAKILHRKA